MKRNTIFLIFTLLLIQCSATKPAELNNIDYINSHSDVIMDMETGLPIRSHVYNGISFKYVLNDKGKTVKRWTKDPKYVTFQGYRVGTMLKNIETRNPVIRKAGYGYVILESHTLYMAFCEGVDCTEKPLTENSKIAWFEFRE